mgnify:CR=1 FL=1
MPPWSSPPSSTPGAAPIEGTEGAAVGCDVGAIDATGTKPLGCVDRALLGPPVCVVGVRVGVVEVVTCEVVVVVGCAVAVGPASV